ncbi:MAG TPA: hypothetical protein VGE58_07705 [Daejeonella sp.]
MAQKDNEAIRILDINGQINPQAEDLHRAVFLMGVSAELSKSEKGLYHAQINPAIGEDAAMQDDHWLQAADILGKQLGLETQSRAIVLHTKKGRTHAHVVWERYDHAHQRMVSDSFSRLAQDRARKEMEATFGQAATPHRNKHRPELKASLSALWHQTGTGAQFVKAARQNSYIISEGSGRSPYMVVDTNGRSYDLTRQLQSVRLKEVRQRLRNETLLGEKDAIALMRKQRLDEQERGGDKGTGKEKNSLTLKIKSMKQEFDDNSGEISDDSRKQPDQKQNTKQVFKDNKPDATGQQKDKSVKDKFVENKEDSKTEHEKDKERRRAEFRQRMQNDKQLNQTREKGMDIE